MDPTGKYQSMAQYPDLMPEFAELPPEVDGPSEDDLIEHDSYEDAGETADIDLPPMRAPVDARVSRPEKAETKDAYEPPPRGDIGITYQS